MVFSTDYISVGSLVLAEGLGAMPAARIKLLSDRCLG